MTSQYVYGVTSQNAASPQDLSGVDDQPVSYVRRGELAAIVSDLAADRPLGTKADLLAHNAVIEAVAAGGASVLPFRFGSVMTDAAAVADELLDANAERFGQEVARLVGRVQMTVRGQYVEEPVLREVLRENSEAQRLTEKVRTVPEDAAYYDRIRLGEVVAETMREKSDIDGQHVIETLAPYSEAVSPHHPDSPGEVVDAAFLVPEQRRGEFERAVEELAREMSGRVRLRLVGPLAPYDFAGEDAPI